MEIFKFTLITFALTLLVPIISAYYGEYYNGFNNGLANWSPGFRRGYGQLGQNDLAYEAASGLSGFGQRHYGLSGISQGGHSLSGFNDGLSNVSPTIGGRFGQNGLVYGTASGVSGYDRKYYGLSGIGQIDHSLSGFGQGEPRLSGYGTEPFEHGYFGQYYRNGFRR